jgi:hypothetical protein
LPALQQTTHHFIVDQLRQAGQRRDCCGVLRAAPPFFIRRGSITHTVTLRIKVDGNAVLSYCTPREGWRGFGALNGADFKIKHDGVDKGAELGAVF